MEHYEVREGDYIDQMSPKQANKEIKRLEKQFPGEIWKKVFCDTMHITYDDFQPADEVETDKGYCWVVRDFEAEEFLAAQLGEPVTDEEIEPTGTDGIPMITLDIMFAFPIQQIEAFFGHGGDE